MNEENPLQEKEEKKGTGSLKNVKRKRKASDLLLQLAVVIAGILITFQGSSWIDRNAQKRQMKEILESVRNELDQNRLIMEKSLQWIQMELAAADFFSRHVYNLKNMPLDSVGRHIDIIESMTQYEVVSNALQVLKASSVSVNVIDKSLLQGIFTCYDNMGKLFNNLIFYSDRKIELMNAFWATTDSRKITNFRNDPLPYIESYYSNDAARNLLMRTNALLRGNAANIAGMIGVIQYMNKTIDDYIAGKKIYVE